MIQQFLNCEKLISAGEQMLQLVSQKFEEIAQLKHPVIPNVKPGFLRKELPQFPPQQPEELDVIIKDTETKIFPGLTLWSHPNFFAWYPSNITHASIVAEIFTAAFGTPGFQWIASPVQTELENIVVDWMVYAMGLPEKFLMKNIGGGTIASTVSDAVYITIHTAKLRKMRELKIDASNPLMCKFVGYYSLQTHASSYKGLLMKDIHYKREIPIYFDDSVQNFQMDLILFEQMVKDDISNGLIPFWCDTTWGTTQTCAYEQIGEIANIAKKYGIWVNLDAAYAGSAWLLEEYRCDLTQVDSLQINFGLLMMTNMGGTLFYVSDKSFLAEAMGNKFEYDMYKNEFSENGDVWDYKDWSIALGRRFNSLKMWFMIRSLGIEGMKQHLIHKIDLSKYFATLLTTSDKFKLFTKQELTLTTFYIKGDNLDQENQLTRKIYAKINESTELGYIRSAELNGRFFLRVAIGNHTTTKESIDRFWDFINRL